MLIRRVCESYLSIVMWICGLLALKATIVRSFLGFVGHIVGYIDGVLMCIYGFYSVIGLETWDRDRDRVRVSNYWLVVVAKTVTLYLIGVLALRVTKGYPSKHYSLKGWFNPNENDDKIYKHENDDKMFAKNTYKYLQDL